MQLDRIPPRIFAFPGTNPDRSGVEPFGSVTLPAAIEAPRRRPRFFSWMAVSAVCWSLLGQGEVYRIDPRFASPSATIHTYWESLRLEDVDQVSQCFADPATAVPRPGTVWFLPPSDRLRIATLRYAPGEDGTVIATYQVRFRPQGTDEEMQFVTGSELIRVRGEWRLIGLADSEWPDWERTPRAVDM